MAWAEDELDGGDAPEWNGGPFGRTSPLGRAWHWAATRRAESRGAWDRRDAALELSAWLLVVAWWWPLVRVLMDLRDTGESQLGRAADLVGVTLADTKLLLLLLFSVLVARSRRNGVSAPMRVALHATTVPMLFGGGWTLVFIVKTLLGADVPEPFFPSVGAVWWLLLCGAGLSLAWTAGDVLDGE